jgi:Ran GTPase-activating protein (RanGAP) involved in mRNA processing and transport
MESNKISEFEKRKKLEDLFRNLGEHGTETIAKVISRQINLKYVILDKLGFGDREMGTVANLVARGKELKELSLCESKVTVKGVIVLSRALAIAPSLSILRLSENIFDDEGVDILGKAIRLNKSIKVLFLESCFFGTGAGPLLEGLIHNNTVENLHLKKSPLGKEGEMMFSKLLAFNIQLKTIGAYGCGITEEGGQAMLRSLSQNLAQSSLKLLEIDGNRVTEKTQQEIAKRIAYIKIRNQIVDLNQKRALEPRLWTLENRKELSDYLRTIMLLKDRMKKDDASILDTLHKREEEDRRHLDPEAENRLLEKFRQEMEEKLKQKDKEMEVEIPILHIILTIHSPAQSKRGSPRKRNLSENYGVKGSKISNRDEPKQPH